MSNLVNLVRSWFCNHEFVFEEVKIVEKEFDRIYNKYIVKREGIRVSATCEKCLFHKSYWKHL